ncbi:MAG TPA: DUF1707 domain-containing protein [Streptosporangiaceae bacterium]|jgi:hypothetical protein
MAARPDLRIGDSEREAAATRLREHYAQGRLSLEEFNQRLDAIFAARTERQLAQVSSDLPHAAAPQPGPGRPGPGQPRPGHAGPGAGWSGPHRQYPRYRSAPRLLRLLPIMIALAVLWLLMAGFHLGFAWPGRLAIFVAVLAVARKVVRWIWRQSGTRRFR